MYEKTRSAMPLGLNQELNQSKYESNYLSFVSERKGKTFLAPHKIRSTNQS